MTWNCAETALSGYLYFVDDTAWSSIHGLIGTPCSTSLLCWCYIWMGKSWRTSERSKRRGSIAAADTDSISHAYQNRAWVNSAAIFDAAAAAAAAITPPSSLTSEKINHNSRIKKKNSSRDRKLQLIAAVRIVNSNIDSVFPDGFYTFCFTLPSHCSTFRGDT